MGLATYIQRIHGRLGRARTERPASPRPELVENSKAAQWLSVLVFIGLTSVAFAVFVEWHFYQDTLGWTRHDITPTDSILILWLFCAKTLLLFFPLLVVDAALLLSGRTTALRLVTEIGWTAVFFFLTADLIALRFVGNHASEYLPYISEFLKTPEYAHFHRDIGGISFQGIVVLCGIGLIGWVIFSVVRRLLMALVVRAQWLARRPAMALATTGFVFAAIAVVPGLAFVSDDALLDKIYSALPIDTKLIDDFSQDIKGIIEAVRRAVRPSANASFLSITPQPAGTKWEGRQVFLANDSDEDLDLRGWTLQDAVGRRFGLTFILKGRSSGRISLPRNMAPAGQYLIIQPSGQLHSFVKWDPSGVFPRLVLGDDHGVRVSGEPIDVRGSEDEVRRLFEDAAEPKPVDPHAFTERQPLPNVILISVESFRPSTVGPDGMKYLADLAEKGMYLQHHYSGSNCSHLGLFSLFYGRTCHGYRQTLDRNIAPQLCESMRRSGYHLAFVTAGELEGFMGMEKFVGEKTFHDVILVGSMGPKEQRDGFQEWPNSDRRKLDQIRKIVTGTDSRPQFAYAHLLSSQYPYAFPSEFAVHQPCGKELLGLINWRRFTSEQSHNRYKNAILFVDSQLQKFVQSIDLEKNIVIVTGDHGESMGEDGVRSHASRLSEVQTRVPFVIVGAGVPRSNIRFPTGHADLVPTLLHLLAGKHVPITGCHGRDLLSNDSLPDEVVISDARTLDMGEIVLLTRDTRLVFKAHINGGRVETMGLSGLLDEFGRPIAARLPARTR